MRVSPLGASGLLLLAAMLWGFSFAFKQMGLEHLGPFSFNALRFGLGALSLLPVLWFFRHSQMEQEHKNDSLRGLIKAGCICGLFMFFGATFQQIGLLYTNAAKAGFITGFYLILVPIFGLFLGHRTGKLTWVGGSIAVTGLFFLAAKDDPTVEFGDGLEFINACFWAGHVLAIGYFGSKFNPLKLSLIQLIFCSLASVPFAWQFESLSVADVMLEWQSLLYTGVASVGIAYTIQVIAQRKVPVAHAAALMSMESVFAVVGAWWILGETLSFVALTGCGLMLAGIMVSQFQGTTKQTA